jgi:tetratricopeptide (TPR) repeat protein
VLLIDKQPSARHLYELGLTFAALGDLPAAAAALRRASTQADAPAGAWTKLGDVLAQMDDLDGAEAAYAAQAQAPGADMENHAGRTDLNEATGAWLNRIAQDPEGAGPSLRAHLKADPTDAAALRVLAEIAILQGQYAFAERLLVRASGLAPSHQPLRSLYLDVLMAQGKHAQALPVIDRLVAEQPGKTAFRKLRARCLAALGEVDLALDDYKGVITKLTKDPDMLIPYAELLRSAGRGRESERFCRACIARGQGAGRAWWSLAQSKTDGFSKADMQAMRRSLEDGRLPETERVALHYAFGAALERASDYAESFVQYTSGARLKRASLRYDAAEWSREVLRHTAFFTNGHIEAIARHGHADPAPIFIIGFPRVGSTLIEQILASHSAVEGTRELTELGAVAGEIGLGTSLGAASAYPGRLLTLRPEAVAGYGAQYIERTRRFRHTAKPFFIDKMPNNWLYLGLICSILPNAKIIDARRHPVATCFAAFKHLFADGAHYSYSLEELARCYNDYDKTMAHFRTILPNRVHRVDYETLVTDTETEIRRLLAYCGLRFEPACLRFWETRRVVASPSAERVRQPIFATSVDQWRNYAPWLAPLQEALRVAPAPPREDRRG